MNHVIIGTAGHVDHGKTRLIQALTGVDTDRLPEEKARGLTIELGFAPLNFPDGLQAGIVDVPGHEKFIRHMLCGAGGMDLALLTVAADEGVMPQTEEHLEILELLGLRAGLVALTKADLADGARLEAVRRQVLARLRGTFLEDCPLIPVSALTGAGVSELRETLHRMALDAPPRNTELPFRLPLDRVFTVEGFGTVVTGTLLEGTLRREDTVELSPSGRFGRVRGLQIFGREVEAACAGQRVAVNLARLRKEELRRGDVLCAPGSLPASLLLDVELWLLDSARNPLASGAQVQLFHGAALRPARAVLLGRESLAPGQRAFAQLRLLEPLGTRAGDRLVLRLPSPAQTAGGGVILDAAPRRHRRNDPAALEVLAVKSSGSPARRLLQGLEELGAALPDRAALARLLPGQSPDAPLAELLASGQVLEPLPGRYLASSVLQTLRERCGRTLASYHREHPLQAGIRPAELWQKTGLPPEFLEYLTSEGALQAVGERYALPGFRIVLTRRQEAVRRTILGLCAGMGHRAPGPEALASKFPLRDREDCRRVLESLLSEGELVLLAPGRLCHAQDLAEYRQAAETWLRSCKTLTLAEYRDLLGVSRDYALAVLEYLDRRGVTRREGDARVLAGGTAPDASPTP